MYQSEILVDVAFGMSNALRFLVFIGLKALLQNLIESKEPMFQTSIQSIFHFFGIFQFIALIIIYIFMMETKGLTSL